MHRKPHSQETKDKISRKLTGVKLSPERIEKMRLSRVGKKRKPFTNQHIQAFKEAWIRRKEKGLGGANSGSFKRGGTSPYKGKKESAEVIEKKRVRMMGKRFHITPHSEKTKQTIREKRMNQKPIFKETSIERKMEKALTDNCISYQKQVPLCKVSVVDFFIPEYKIVIQCDGDYWHNLPDHKVRDNRQDEILAKNGYKIFRFWESEINNHLSECLMVISNYIHAKRNT